MLQLQVSNFFTMQSRAVPLHPWDFIKTIIIKHRLHYTRKQRFFSAGIVYKWRVLCIICDYMQYAHCTQIISSLITHNALYEGVKTKKINLKCIVYVRVLKRTSVYFYCLEEQYKGNVYVNRKRGLLIVGTVMCSMQKILHVKSMNLQCVWLVSK